ncbi:(2Fe-2S)-binding protein, partial [Pseudomonas viridiflava]
AWLPVRDDAGRSSAEQVYLAGDGAGIMGADAAEMAGELAALSLLQDCGRDVDEHRIDRLKAQLKHITRFRHGLETAFPFPDDWAANVPDETLICRCEEVSAGDIRRTVQEGHWEMNRVKAMCRVGMGRCQGRMCGLAAAELVACESGRPVQEVGRLRGQSPIKPIPFGVETQA